MLATFRAPGGLPLVGPSLDPLCPLQALVPPIFNGNNPLRITPPHISVPTDRITTSSCLRHVHSQQPTLAVTQPSNPMFSQPNQPALSPENRETQRVCRLFILHCFRNIHIDPSNQC